VPACIEPWRPRSRPQRLRDRCGPRAHPLPRALPPGPLADPLALQPTPPCGAFLPVSCTEKGSKAQSRLGEQSGIGKRSAHSSNPLATCTCTSQPLTPGVHAQRRAWALPPLPPRPLHCHRGRCGGPRLCLGRFCTLCFCNPTLQTGISGLPTYSAEHREGHAGNQLSVAVVAVEGGAGTSGARAAVTPRTRSRVFNPPRPCPSPCFVPTLGPAHPTAAAIWARPRRAHHSAEPQAHTCGPAGGMRPRLGVACVAAGRARCCPHSATRAPSTPGERKVQSFGAAAPPGLNASAAK
jgi:hypothetical protein